MKRRKQRVVVDLTFEEPTTEKRAAQYVGRCLDRIEDLHMSVTRFETKQFSRVFAYAKSRDDRLSARRSRDAQLSLPL